MTSIYDVKSQVFTSEDGVPYLISLPSGIDIPGNTLLIVGFTTYSFNWNWPNLDRWGFNHVLGGGVNDAGGPGALHDWWAREITGTEGWAGDGTDVLSLEEYVLPAHGYNPRAFFVAYCLQGAGMPFPWDNTAFTPPWVEGDDIIAISGCVIRTHEGDPGQITAPPSGLAVRAGYASGAMLGGMQASIADATWPQNGGPFTVGTFTVTGTTDYFQGVVFVPPNNDSNCGPGSIGRNLSNVPDWYQRCWRTRSGVGDGWWLNGAGAAVLTGVTFGGDSPTWASAMMAQGQSRLQEPPGPYDGKHIARIRFSWESEASIEDFWAQWSYSWEGWAEEPIFEQVTVIMVDEVNSNPSGVYVRDPADPYGTPAFYPMTFTPGEDYILEVDYLINTKVRCALAAEIDTAPYIASMGAWPDGDNIYLSARASDMKAVLIKHIDIARGPVSGARLEGVFIAVGDGTTITFVGYPTVEGTAVWTVMGVIVEPEAIDEVNGAVTFSRPPDFNAIIKLSGLAL